MYVFFLFSLFSLFFKWGRFIFVLISFEFILLNLFYLFSMYFGSMAFFFFICMSVISSVLGLVLMVYAMKYYGNDHCIF